MDAHFVAGLILVCGTAVSERALSAQSSAVQATEATVATPANTPATAPNAPATGADQPISLSGCMAADDRTAEGFRLWEKKTRMSRPIVTTLRTPGWRPVRLVGGFLPSTNIAAQAGSIDPWIVSVAFTDPLQSGFGYPAGTGYPRVVRPPITFVRPLRSSCPTQ